MSIKKNKPSTSSSTPRRPSTPRIDRIRLHRSDYDQKNHTVIERTAVTSSGHFEFHNVGTGAYGAYIVQIATEFGDPIVSAPLDNVSGFSPLQIRLPELENAKPISSLISAARLRHPPSRKAFDEVVKAQKFARADDRPQAIDHLRKAIELSPDYIDAHTNLGAQYIRTDRYPEAEQAVTFLAMF